MKICPRHVEGPFKFTGEYDETAPTCSYCGAMNADQFMDQCERGVIKLGPTDKNYKVYVTGPELHSGQIKFYFQHLSEAQMRRFVDLYNDKTLKLEFPGHFYVQPFFMRTSKPPEDLT